MEQLTNLGALPPQRLRGDGVPLEDRRRLRRARPRRRRHPLAMPSALVMLDPGSRSAPPRTSGMTIFRLSSRKPEPPATAIREPGEALYRRVSVRRTASCQEARRRARSRSRHAGREALVERPARGELVRRGIEARLQSGEIRRAQRRRLQHGRPVDRRVEDVGQALHGPVGRRHAAVDAQHGLRCRAGNRRASLRSRSNVWKHTASQRRARQLVRVRCCASGRTARRGNRDPSTGAPSPTNAGTSTTSCSASAARAMRPALRARRDDLRARRAATAPPRRR